MLGAFDDVLSALRQSGGNPGFDEQRHVAEAIVAASIDMSAEHGNSKRNRRSLAVEATYRYLKLIKALAAQPTE